MDGLVEKFNSTLISMIEKSCEACDHNWDARLPYLLFAYRVFAQESAREAPFFLLLEEMLEYPQRLFSLTLVAHMQLTLMTTRKT